MKQAIRDLALGATLLGTGGGGDPRIGTLMARGRGTRVRAGPVIAPEDVPDDGVVVPVAMIGAPTVILERIPGGHELDLAMDGFRAARCSRPVDRHDADRGGWDQLDDSRSCSAARRGLPLVDADGMGRAFPEVQMVTLGAGGAKAWPLVLADESRNVVAITDAVDNASAERLARSVVVGMGGSADRRSLRRHRTVPARSGRSRTASVLAVAIGRALRTARSENRDADRGHRPTVWRSSPVHRQGRRRQADHDCRIRRGRLSLTGLDEDTGRTAEVDFQNENLVVRSEDEVLAAVPDLISLVEAESGQPLTTEGMRYGVRAHVVGIPSSPLWWRPEALRLVEPRAFGYDMDPIRLEDAR